jgi:hypothetical protein
MLCIGLQFAVIPLSAMAWIGDVTTPADRPSVSGYVLCFRDAGIAAVILMGGFISKTAATFALLAAVSAVCAVIAFFSSTGERPG